MTAHTRAQEQEVMQWILTNTCTSETTHLSVSVFYCLKLLQNTEYYLS